MIPPDQANLLDLQDYAGSLGSGKAVGENAVVQAIPRRSEDIPKSVDNRSLTELVHSR